MFLISDTNIGKKSDKIQNGCNNARFTPEDFISHTSKAITQNINQVWEGSGFSVFHFLFTQIHPHIEFQWQLLQKNSGLSF